MASILERLPRGARVAVIRLRSLGDCVLTTPALRLLKEQRPDLEIGVVVEPRFSAVFDGNPDVVKILAPSARSVLRWQPELCVNFHGGSRSIALTLASRARYRAGFTHFRAQFAYNVRVPRAQDVLKVDRKVHTAEHLASAMFYLGARRTEIPRARLFAPRALRPAPFAILHPFASAPDKTWPAERFIAVAENLRSQGLQPVFLSGPDDDPAPFAQFEVMRNAPLSEVMSAIRSASLFIGNDSGPAHVAAAFRVPEIVLFGASDSTVWAPWRTDAELLAKDPISDISTGDVLSALDRLRVGA